MSTTSTRIRIAIADDDADTLEMLGAFFKSPTNEVHQAVGGRELIDLLAGRGPFDLIVTDVDMPFIEGLAVMRLARAAEITTPVVVVTGFSRPGIEAAVHSLGNARLLRKPIELAKLRGAVAELLGTAT